MEEKVEQAYLYDFYGELLNEHQRRIFEDFILNDLSLGEIAEQEGISRQGVYDLVKRCSRQFREYETKLHLMEKFHRIKEKSEAIRTLAQSDGEDRNHIKAAIIKIADEIIEEL